MNETSIALPNLYIAPIWACGCVALTVFAFMLYSIATFRRTPAEAAKMKGTTAEVLWAIVPIAIVIAMAAPAVRVLFASDGAAPTEIAQRADSVTPPRTGG